MTTARASSLAAMLAILAGLLAILGQSGFGMPAATAAIIVLIGLGLLLTPAAAAARPALPSRAISAAATLASLFFLLVPDGGPHAPALAANLTLLALGVALLCLQARQTPVLTLCALSVFAVILPLYHLAERSLLLLGHNDMPASPFIGMALDAALALCLLAGPALFLHPRLPFGRHLFAADAHGRLMLTIMPWGTIAPVLLAVAIHYATSQDSQYIGFAIVVALGLLSALTTALLWRGYEKLRASESALSDSEARLNAMLRTLPDLVWLKDPEGVFLVCNPPVARLFGVSVARVIGRTDYDFHPPAVAAALIAGDRAAIAAGGPCINEGSVVYADDGRRADFETIKTPVFDAAGGLIGVLGIARDITARRQMESDLRERENLTRAVMNSLTSSIAVLDRNGKIVRVNDAWHKFAAANGGGALLQGGIDLDYLEACRRAAAIDPLAARVLTGLEGMLAGELPHFSLEYPCHGPHEQRWFIMQARPLVGAMPGLVLSHLDITQRKLAELDLAAHKNQLEHLVAQRTRELENARAQAELILESTADGIFGLDMQGRIVFINPAASAILGYRDDALIGHPAHPTLHHSHADGRPYPAEECPMLDALHDGRTLHVETEVFWRADHTALSVAYATQPMRVGNRIIGAVVSFHDTSVQRATEQARESVLAEARHLAQAKSEFLANMSHEIRTPLNAVLGLARIGARENIGRKSSHTCQRIVDAGQHLLGVVNDILDFSKIEAGKLRIETRPFRLTAVIDTALGFVAETARAKRIEVTRATPEKPPPDWVAGDPLRIEQILVNLLSNAVKFTPHGHVRLLVESADDAPTVRFQVADTGIGMNAEQVSRLFGAFEQADGSTTREYGGSGLGLAISRRLAHLMHGDIAVESAPGVGSTFTLALPLPAAEPDAAPAPLAITATLPLAGLHLLAADDIEVNRLILDDLLTREGARTIFAANGAEALERIEEHGAAAFDAVLMDVQMPVMDGYAATREIHTRAPYLPVIGLTAHALAEERENCLAAGMVEHVVKPIDPAALVAAILRHVQARGPAPIPVAALAPTEVAPPAALPTAAVTAAAITDGVAEAADAVPPAPTFSAPLIDWAALRERFNQRDDFLRKLAATVRDNHGATAAKLVDAAARQDFAALAFLAHGLKGVGGNLFAPRLSDLASAAEIAARAKQPEAAALAAGLARQFDAFLTELTELTKLTEASTPLQPGPPP